MDQRSPPPLLSRTNMFHMNEGGCALVLQKDLEYWIIGNPKIPTNYLIFAGIIGNPFSFI